MLTGKLSLREVPEALSGLETWREILDLKSFDAKIRRWANAEIKEISKMISERDYKWAIQSRINYVSSTLRYVRSGHIKSVTKTGTVWSTCRS